MHAPRTEVECYSGSRYAERPVAVVNGPLVQNSHGSHPLNGVDVDFLGRIIA